MEKKLLAIIVIVIIASLSVAGCSTTNTNQSGTVSTDYPTSGHSTLIEAAIEHQRNSLPSSTQFAVEWKNNTWAITTEDRQDGSTLVAGYTHYPSASEASAFYDDLIRYVYGEDASPSTWYHDITGKWPTVSRATAEPGDPQTTLQQYDALIVQTQLTNATTATETPTVPETPTATPTASSHVVDGMEFHVKLVDSPPQALGSGGYFTPEAGNVFVAFNCTVTNINAPTDSNTRIGVTYWQLRDNVGNVYDAYSFASGTPGITIFKSVDSQPGDIVSGYVFFDVPANHGDWKSLTYNDGGRDVIVSL
jgi:hypothetical protein